MLVYVTLFACAVLLVLLVRRYDLYEKEPWYMVLVAVALGVALMWVAGQVEDVILGHLRLHREQMAAKAAIVSLIEEAAKLGVVLVIATVFRRHFSDALDGLVYGTLGGVGMAVEESLMYLHFTADKNAQALGAEVVRLFAHSLMGGLLGFAAGLTLRPPDRDPATRSATAHARRRIALPATCVAVALVVHFCWDYIAYRPHVAAAMRGVLMLLMLSLMLVWGAMVAYGMELSRRFLRADATPVAV
jgi:RsiW-degrading membrane proteinase PrsW (M82 family)